MKRLAIRRAEPDDSDTLLGFIRELAEYEKLLHAVVADAQKIRMSLFGPHAKSRAILAELDGQPIGFALYFFNYSTFLGQQGLYIEDLYIQPHYRGTGYGKQILRWLAEEALSEDCGRMEWAVLDWNAPSIAFYKSLGAEALEDWTLYRLTAPHIKKLAQQR
jgi:GNAT superfamily N-acetyltransferase